MLRFIGVLVALGGCLRNYDVGFDGPDARPEIPNVPVAAVECLQPCVPVTPADTVVAFETVWYAVAPGASAATPERYTIAAHCTGLACDVTPPSVSVRAKA